MDKPAPRKARRQENVEIAFLEAVHKRCRHNRRVWEALGDLYTRTGRFEDGLEMDLRMAKVWPHDPMVQYNLACSCALTGRPGEALDALERAARAGYNDADWMSRDRDLKSLREDPRFRALLRRIRALESPPPA
jgi:predicted Zn-dependent protease